MQANQNIKKNSLTILLNKVTSNRLFWIIAFSLLTVAGAQIAIPIKPVPFSLQTMMVVLAGAFLGSKNGAYSQLLYLFLGSIGLPVFANGAMGIAYLFGPTGGYLLAFPLGAFLTGYIVEKNKNYIVVTLAMFAGEALVIICGTLFLNIFYIKDFSEALKVGGILFSLATVIKVFAAVSIYFGVTKNSEKLP
jgi:biotin transport system substrate-specific component